MHWNCMMICVMLFFPYADLRAKWHTFSIEEKMDKDSFRTACHDNVILHFNMIARYLKMQGKEVQWREQLGDEKVDKAVRKRYRRLWLLYYFC